MVSQKVELSPLRPPSIVTTYSIQFTCQQPYSLSAVTTPPPSKLPPVPGNGREWRRAGAVARLERAGISGRFGRAFSSNRTAYSFQIALSTRLAMGGQPEQMSSQLRLFPHPHWHGSCWANIMACVPFSSIKRTNRRPNEDLCLSSANKARTDLIPRPPSLLRLRVWLLRATGPRGESVWKEVFL